MAELRDKNGVPVLVRLDEQLQAYLIADAESGIVMGRCFFLDHGEDRIFFHTEVPDEFGGRGLATVLVAQAVTDTKEVGKTIVALCPVVRGYLDKHRAEYAGSMRMPSTKDIAVVKQSLSER